MPVYNKEKVEHRLLFAHVNFPAQSLDSRLGSRHLHSNLFGYLQKQLIDMFRPLNERCEIKIEESGADYGKVTRSHRRGISERISKSRTIVKNAIRVARSAV
jgi:hypothetical protein